ncbi:MAG: hypothetical protein AAGL49_15060, partial [Pseudomonadota bacterium]
MTSSRSEPARTLRKAVAALLPRPLVNFGWNLALDLGTIPARLKRREGPPLPWNVRHNVGGAAYFEVGANLLTRFRAQAGLTPS